ncbi:MAG: sporulation protein YqfD [Oscillospiraceae bacterium]|jgi:similar to stage IV sporulation protein|nr:sporulation protein YqfD [Oscillospiraceae bacterium]
MSNLPDYIRGSGCIEAKGAEPARFLEECTEAGLEFWDCVPIDDFTLRLNIRLADAGRIDRAATKSNCEATLISMSGTPVYMKRLRRRFILWILPLLFGATLVLSSFFIWRIEIHGNETVTETEILNVLDECGVGLGSFWPNFTSDSVRNQVLSRLPELKWLSVSVFGSRAYIEVREATEIPKIFDEGENYQIVASQGGLIEQVRALRGTAVFSQGQTVSKGEVLIDSKVVSPHAGISFEHAKGVVLARTWYELTAALPINYSVKDYSGGTRTRFALKIGDSRINFYRSSRILGNMCDNIVTEKKLGIRDLFTLPVSLITERFRDYELIEASFSELEARQLLTERLRAELLRAIGDGGEILDSELTITFSSEAAVATLRAECRQDIAEERLVSVAGLDMAQGN